MIHVDIKIPGNVFVTTKSLVHCGYVVYIAL